MEDYRLASSTLSPYLRTASELGVDPAGLLADLNLSIDTIETPQSRLPLTCFMEVIDRLIQTSRNESIGLHSAKYVDVGSYDINGYISINCANLLEALTLTSEYYRVLSDHRVLHVTEGQKYVTCHWKLAERSDIAQRNFADSLLATYVRFGRLNLQMERGVEFVTFKHAAPRSARALQLYEETFKCPLLFDQEQYSVVFDRAFLRNTRIARADPALRDVLIGHATTRIRSIETTPPFSHEVKSLIRRMFHDSAPTREDVADRLHVGSRTLQRRLLMEGSSYKDVFNAVRLELAVQYLKDESLSLDDVAEKLGFSETRSLHRSFRQWTGNTPGEFRAKSAAATSNS
ncbi:AraC-like DNA-binding protein [Povalibacter uvarum]|uniref:AraC-like DNA-binding protein n=1 Tax=Povalibacter uvarum TaxID=732238 RepID=A0A841HJT8_9GAMM|nr:AraC family transcriptional regulator [Povalibacter uvarum]MBB6092412.1 AraC-like DNA-binding protein [Povalibacter uvarum]